MYGYYASVSTVEFLILCRKTIRINKIPLKQTKMENSTVKMKLLSNLSRDGMFIVVMLHSEVLHLFHWRFPLDFPLRYLRDF